MKEGLGIILLGGVAVVAITAVVLGGAELSYRLSAHYAPLHEQVRRNTFEQSRAFQEGSVRDLDNLRIQYAGGTPAQKDAIASTARHRFQDIPEDILTPELRSFRSQVESN